MNDINYHEAVIEAVKGKFKDKQELVSRAIPQYLDSAEREYTRVARQYTKILNTELKKRLPEIMREYKKAKEKGKGPDAASFTTWLHAVILEVANKITEKEEKANLEKQLENVAKMAHKKSVQEWKRVIRKTFGIEILDEYYESETYDQVLFLWLAANSTQVRDIPNRALVNIERVISDGIRSKKNMGEIKRDVQNAYTSAKQSAVSVARDQVSTLNYQLTEMEHRDAGVTKYKWKSMRDSRVREAHREFDGKVFKWSEPPAEWYMTKSRGKVYTGKRFHPGEAYACRCIAVPVFDRSTLVLPMK